MSSLLEVSGVSKSFGGVHALATCHLDVKEGHIHGLIGPNGSGKTTLFNVITGYERIQQGEVRFGGTEITNAPPDRVFGLGIGRTFQLTRIFGRLSVLENMLVATQRKQGWLRGVINVVFVCYRQLIDGSQAKMSKPPPYLGKKLGIPRLTLDGFGEKRITSIHPRFMFRRM